MLHSKFLGHRSIGAREEFFMDFIIYGLGGRLGHVTQLICKTFYSHSPISIPINLVSNDPRISEKIKANKTKKKQIMIIIIILELERPLDKVKE